VLVRPNGVVKITDFGIAYAAGAVPLTRTGTLVGTAYYLSPEQASGEPVTPASDVYSLGVVAYECLAGQRPFPGNNPIAVAQAQIHQAPPPLPPDIPAPVQELVGAALSKDPAARPASAGDVAATAMALLHHPVTPPTRVLPTSPPLPTTPAPTAVPRHNSHRTAVRLASLLL